MRLEPLVRNKLSGAYSRAVSSKGFQSLMRRSIVTRDALTDTEAVRCLWFDVEERFEVTAPFSTDPLPEEIAKTIGEHRIGQPFVCELEDVELVGPDAVAMTQENNFVFEESLGSVELLLRSLLRAVSNGTLPRRKSVQADPDIETAVSLVGPWCRGYYHWFSDYLLRLQGVEHFVAETGTKPALIVPPDPPEWMESSLDFAGFNDFVRIPWTTSRLTVGTLVIPSLRRETDITKPEEGYIFSPRAYRWLGERIRSSVENTDEEAQIFISREKAAERHVVNQGELMDALSDRGFKAYVLEDMSFRDQVRLFAEANAIVAPNGAGLVNMIYATDTNVVTLFGAYINACYPNLADSLGFENAVVRCQPLALDMRVDPDKVVETLDHF